MKRCEDQLETSFTDRPQFGLQRRLNVTLGAVILLLLVTQLNTAFAGSATWKASPTSGNWTTASNWSPATVPNGLGDKATFQSSNKTSISLSGFIDPLSLDGIVFDPGASAFTITPVNGGLGFRGTGVTNNSGATQTFVTTYNSRIVFWNNSSAGNAAFFAFVSFYGTATAGSATFTISDEKEVHFAYNATAGNATFTNSRYLYFDGDSTAGNAFITTAGASTASTAWGYTAFNESTSGTASAGSATIVNQGSSISGGYGGHTWFGNTSSAGNATLIANGGTNGGYGGLIDFHSKAQGGAARVELFGNGTLDISPSYNRLGGVTVGSIEGDGQIFLGQSALSVGTNNSSRTFSGLIQDGNRGGQFAQTGGSLIKIGKGVLALTSVNTYTGGTIIKTGTLLAATNAGSATGTGSVRVVNSATLGGSGKISGAVTVGDGTHSGATLLGGSNAATRGTLSIDNTLTFNPLSTYKCVLNRTSGNASRINAVGVTINSGANFTLVDTGVGTLAPGTVLMVISNLSASPLAGTFANLADGSTFTSNGNSFRANYQGNDGNDLTLTVLP